MFILFLWPIMYASSPQSNSVLTRLCRNVHSIRRYVGEKILSAMRVHPTEEKKKKKTRGKKEFRAPFGLRLPIIRHPLSACSVTPPCSCRLGPPWRAPPSGRRPRRRSRLRSPGTRWAGRDSGHRTRSPWWAPFPSCPGSTEQGSLEELRGQCADTEKLKDKKRDSVSQKRHKMV